MKTLVIDDRKINLEAAEAQLGDQDLTVISTYDEARKLLEERHEFEVVLVDLLLPASDRSQGPEGKKFVGQEMPIGIFLALLAAKNGAKYAAVFTDSNHHCHPASACFDAFGPWGTFTVNEAKFFLCNETNWVNHFRPDNLNKEMSFEDCEDWYQQHKPLIEAKNWRKLFDFMTKPIDKV